MREKQDVRVSAGFSFDRAVVFINRLVDSGFTVLAKQQGARWVICASMDCAPDAIEKIGDDIKEGDHAELG